MPDRWAFVAPALDEGRFDAHVEGRDRVVDEEPNGFGTIEEAVAWARERAEVVLVRTVDGEAYRSAGRRPPPGRPGIETWSA
jgi:hypothetical protein